MIGRASGACGWGAALLIQVLFSSACSPVNTRLPAALPTSASWLGHLNNYRAAAALPPLTENTAWSAGTRKHAIYIVTNNALQHREDPDNSGYTPAGQTAAQQSNVFISSDGNETDRGAIDTWMQSPFHALGILDPRLVQVGFGSHRAASGNPRMGAALNVLAGLSHTTQTTHPIFWPGHGTTVPIGLHQVGYPSSLASCPGYAAPSGLPLILQIGSGNLPPVVTATSFTQNGQALEHCVFDERTYSNPDRTQQQLGRKILGARAAIVLIPRSPLTSGTTYAASLVVNGETYAWSFTIASSAQGVARQNQ